MSLSVRQTNTSCHDDEPDQTEPGQSRNLSYILDRLHYIRTDIEELARIEKDEGLLRAFESIVGIVVGRVSQLKKGHVAAYSSIEKIKSAVQDQCRGKTPAQSQTNQHALIETSNHIIDYEKEAFQNNYHRADESIFVPFTRIEVSDLKNNKSIAELMPVIPLKSKTEDNLGFEYSAERYQVRNTKSPATTRDINN